MPVCISSFWEKPWLQGLPWPSLSLCGILKSNEFALPVLSVGWQGVPFQTRNWASTALTIPYCRMSCWGSIAPLQHLFHSVETMWARICLECSVEVQPKRTLNDAWQKMMFAAVVQMLLHSSSNLFSCSHPENMEWRENLWIYDKNRVLVHGDLFSWYLQASHFPSRLSCCHAPQLRSNQHSTAIPAWFSGIYSKQGIPHLPCTVCIPLSKATGDNFAIVNDKHNLLYYQSLNKIEMFLEYS